MDEPTVPCSCCGGTGGVVKRGVGSGQSEAALLRSELIRVWDIFDTLLQAPVTLQPGPGTNLYIILY